MNLSEVESTFLFTDKSILWGAVHCTLWKIWQLPYVATEFKTTHKIANLYLHTAVNMLTLIFQPNCAVRVNLASAIPENPKYYIKMWDGNSYLWWQV